MATSGCINKIHLVHVQPRKIDSIAGYKNKKTRRCDRQGVWQIAPTLQDQPSEVTFVCPAWPLRRLVTIHGRAFAIIRT
jgi:hypothetical protein